MAGCALHDQMPHMFLYMGCLDLYGFLEAASPPLHLLDFCGVPVTRAMFSCVMPCSSLVCLGLAAIKWPMCLCAGPPMLVQQVA